MRDIKDYSLKAHNTFGIEAKCARFIEYSSVEEAQEVARILRETGSPYLIIGGGSNLLLTRDFEGIVVHSAILGMWIEDDRMTCGSGEVWDEVVEASLMAGLYGAENLSMIPGDVGASAVQNIGAYGVEVKDLIREIHAVEIATGQERVIDARDCQYAYRQSRFKNEWKDRFLITSVTYQFSKTFVPHLDYGNLRENLVLGSGPKMKNFSLGPDPSAKFLREAVMRIRGEKLPDPKVEGNAGSFFMNPIVEREKYEALAATYPTMPHYEVDEGHVKIPAGWMIDQCGWKGKSLGHAGVHDKQALVLVNLGGASGQEIVVLCRAIQKDVKEKFGIDIYPEVNIV